MGRFFCVLSEYARALNERPYICKFKQLNKLEFGGQSPLTMRAWCSVFRYCPNPLGIVPAEQFDKLEFVKLFLSEKTYNSFRLMGK